MARRLRRTRLGDGGGEAALTSAAWTLKSRQSIPSTRTVSRAAKSPSGRRRLEKGHPEVSSETSGRGGPHSPGRGVARSKLTATTSAKCSRGQGGDPRAVEAPGEADEHLRRRGAGRRSRPCTCPKTTRIRRRWSRRLAALPLGPGPGARAHASAETVVRMRRSRSRARSPAAPPGCPRRRTPRRRAGAAGAAMRTAGRPRAQKSLLRPSGSRTIRQRAAAVSTAAATAVCAGVGEGGPPSARSQVARGRAVPSRRRASSSPTTDTRLIAGANWPRIGRARSSMRSDPVSEKRK